MDGSERGGVPIVWEPMRLRLRLLSQEFRKKIYALAASCSSVGGEGVKSRHAAKERMERREVIRDESEGKEGEGVSGVCGRLGVCRRGTAAGIA